MNIGLLKHHWLTCIIIFLLGTLSINNAVADEIRPALLNINESSPGWFDVTWKTPTRGNKALALKPIFPKSFVAIASPSSIKVPGAWIQQSTYKSNGKSLVGETIAIDGLSTVQTDVLLNINFQNGRSHSTILRPASPSFQIPALETKTNVAWSYWRMGMFHILEGVDHLLFLFAIILIVSGFKNLLKTITAFTIAHSITLSLASLGVVHIPAAPTEAIISLSIIFLATEIIRKYSGEYSLTESYPWSIAFIFGLFHGLGFAGALAEVGLPTHEIPLALFSFNVGVETGQVIFLIAVISIINILRRIRIQSLDRAWQIMPYTIGGISSFWTIERIVAFF